MTAALPHPSVLKVAGEIRDAFNALSTTALDALPDEVRESIQYWDDAAEKAEEIASTQPERLSPYRDLLVSELGDATDAESLIDRLLSSYTLAAILADEASAPVEDAVCDEPEADRVSEQPVTAKPKPRAPRKTAAKKAAPKPVPVPEAPDEVDEGQAGTSEPESVFDAGIKPPDNIMVENPASAPVTEPVVQDPVEPPATPPAQPVASPMAAWAQDADDDF